MRLKPLVLYKYLINTACDKYLQQVRHCGVDVQVMGAGILTAVALPECVSAAGRFRVIGQVGVEELGKVLVGQVGGHVSAMGHDTHELFQCPLVGSLHVHGVHLPGMVMWRGPKIEAKQHTLITGSM